MKGTFFNKPLEFSLNVDGESWKQGEHISGNLIIKNHGPSEVGLAEFGVSLAYGDSKKVKAKNDSAFQTINNSLFDTNSKISSGEESNLVWKFHLDSNCAITEKKGSMYVICGAEKTASGVGQLQLQITPQETLTNFLEIFKLFFNFKIHSMKNKKGALEVKLMAPQSKELSAVEHLLLLMKMDGDDLILTYNFKVKKLSYAETVVSVKSQNIDFSQTLKPEQYKMFGDSPNHDGMKSAISEIIDQVRRKVTF